MVFSFLANYVYTELDKKPTLQDWAAYFGVGLSASRAIPFVPSTSALSPTKRAGRKTAEPVSLRLDAIFATSEARKPTGFVESSPRRVGNSTSLTVADTGSPQQEGKPDFSRGALRRTICSTEDCEQGRMKCAAALKSRDAGSLIPARALC